MGRPNALVAVIGGLLALAACGSERADTSDGDPAQANPTGGLPADVVPDDYSGRFRVTNITVLASPDHGPQLCGYVAESYPPQCEGPDIEGWDWSEVEHESAHGTSWGEYDVVGTYEDDVLTLTEPPTDPIDAPPDDPDPALPCPEPPGGWKAPDPSKGNTDDMERAISTAHDIEGYASGWIGWLIPDDDITEKTSGDPANFVLVVRTTDDIAAMEAAVREVWGGNLCVAEAEHTARELNQIADELVSTPGMVSVGTDDVAGKATITVWVATESLWERLVAEHGADVIDLSGMLQPIDDHK